MRALPSRVGVYFVLALCLFPGVGYPRCGNKLIAALDTGSVPSVSGKALRDLRRRVGVAPLEALFDVLAGPVARPTTRACGSAGTGRCPSTAARRLRCPTPDRGAGGQDAGRARRHRVPGGGADDPGRDRHPRPAGRGVRTARDRGDRLRAPPAGPARTQHTGLVRGFDGAAFLTELAGTGAQFLVRVCSTRRPPVLARLDDGSFLSRIGALTVRIITADITVTCADGTRYTASYRLVTTLVDPRRYPAAGLIALYHERWEHEIAYLALRHTLLQGRSCDGRPQRPAAGNVGPAHRLSSAAHRHGGRGRNRPRHRPRPGQLRHRPGNSQRPARQGRKLITANDDLVGRMAARYSTTCTRPEARTSLRKVKSPLSRYNKKDPYRPERSTPITGVAVTISDPEPKDTTHQSKCLTTALGP